MSQKAELEKLGRKAAGLGISADGSGGYTRHVLMCTGSSCCSSKIGKASWKHLNKRIRQLKLRKKIYCSEVECFGICKSGPLMLVYPEGIWYRNVTIEVCERVITEHLQNGSIVEEFVFARNPLIQIDD